MTDRRFYEHVDPNGRGRSAPAALRNRGPIAEVLAEWLPNSGTVLEIASGTGEHATFLAGQFRHLQWQPSDTHPEALASIAAWRAQAGVGNLREPMTIDSASPPWALDRADAILCINMVHISPWDAALGLLDGAARLLSDGAPLILYGPWIIDGVDTAPSNLAFDADLRRRDPHWGLRLLSDFRAQADARGLVFEQCRVMPANNVMLLFRRIDPAAA